MTSDELNNQKALHIVMTVLARSVAEAPDDEVLAEVKAAGREPEKLADHVRKVLGNAVEFYTPRDTSSEETETSSPLSDPESCERIFKEYAPQINAFLLRMTGYNPSTAEDLLHDVFVKAFEKLDNIREKENIRAYLYKTARNAMIDLYRQREKRQEIFIDDVTGFDPLSKREMPELKHDLEKAIQDLPSQQRTALVLRHIHGLSYREIAQLMGISCGTVSAHVFFARTQLRAALEHKMGGSRTD